MINTRLVRRLVFLLMVQAVLLPINGPWLDLHFAERQPQHKHMYTGSLDLLHHETQSSEVVSLPDQDATSLGPAMWLLLTGTRPVLSGVGDSELNFTLPDVHVELERIFLPPRNTPKALKSQPF